MNVAVILPARLASTRLPGKLLLDRSGKTVLEHTLDLAKEARAASQGLISRILVAADDPKLIAVSRRADIEAVLTDSRHQSGTDRIAEAAAGLKEEIIVNLQADEPEVEPQSILEVVKLLTEQDATAPMSTLATPITDAEEWIKPNIVKVVLNSAGHALYFSRAPVPFKRDETVSLLNTKKGKRVFGLHHLGLYAYRREFLLNYKNLPPSRLEKIEKLEQLRALEAGFAIRVGVVNASPPGIDTPEDYEAFLRRFNPQSAIRNPQSGGDHG